MGASRASHVVLHLTPAGPGPWRRPWASSRRVDGARALRLAEETRDYVLREAAGDPRISGAVLGGSWVPRDPASVPSPDASLSAR